MATSISKQVNAPVFHALDGVLAHYGTTTSNVVWVGVTIALLVAGFWMARRTPEATRSLEQAAAQSSTT